MRCTPKKTLKRILDSGNDYLVAVKGNQGQLYAQVKAIVTYRQAKQPGLTHQAQQRGRLEQRQVSIFSAAGLDTQQWPGVRTVLCVQRQCCHQGKCSTHQTYYISSVVTTAPVWMAMIRGQWSIENRLHWPKDVLLNEDTTYGREAKALLNTSLFRSIMINLLRLNGLNSVASALRQLANQIEQIFLLLQ